MMEMKVTFSPLTVEPQYLRAVTQAVLDAQCHFAMAAWDAQIRFMGALCLAALAAQRSMVEQLHQAQTRHG